MAEVIDKELEKENSQSTAVGQALPFEVPEKFINIPDDVISMVSTYMSVVINIATPGRNIEVKKILENTKNMFREGVRYHDALWMQHCAASMREILSFLERGHFYTAYQNIKPEDQEAEKILKFFILATTYLSSTVHFRDSAKMGDAEKIYPNQGYGQTIERNFIEKEFEFLEKLCIDIVYTLHHLFTRYCAGAGDIKNHETS